MMEKFSPHLPPPVCNIEDHKKWLRLKLILAAAVFGLLAGVSGAAMMLGWIWPDWGGGNVWSVSRRNANYLSGQLEEKVAREMSEKIFSVYKSSVSLSGLTYLKPADKLGDAIVIGSDGWLAMYVGHYAGTFKNWSALSYDGSFYGIARAVYDKFSGVIYLRLSLTSDSENSNQFKVVNFSDVPRTGDEVFVFAENSWLDSAVGRAIYDFTAPHVETAPVLFYELSGPSRPGAVAVSGQGRVAGLTDSHGHLLSSIYLTRVIPDLLSVGRVDYFAVGVDGWWSAEQPVILNGEAVDGFFVSRVWGARSPLRKGDMILGINGQPMEAGQYLWYNKDATVKLKILRGGKNLEITSRVFPAQ